MKNPSPAELRALSVRARHIAGLLPPLYRTPDGGLVPESRAAVSRCAERTFKQNRAVGGTLVLALPGGASESFHFGYARLAPKIPVTASTCMRIASVSKLVMTLGALSLEAGGLLDLDCDISEYLGYPVRSPYAKDVPVTMRMLLTHTGRITDDGPYGTRGMQPGCTLRELLENPKSWLPCAPGTAFHYSNLGAGAAGVIMELASGMPLDDLMHERIFDPLSIRASFDPRRITPSCDLANGYSVRGILPPRLRYNAEMLAARPPEPFDPERDYLIAAGRMITDTDGMTKLLRLLASRNGMGVLPAASLDAMRTCQDGFGSVISAGRGLNTSFLPGVFDGFSPIGHQGVAYGMCAELFADPQRDAGVGVMTSGVRLVKQPPLMRAGFDLLALGFGALSKLE